MIFSAAQRFATGALIVASCLLAGGSAVAQPKAVAPASAPLPKVDVNHDLVFFVAKGETNACGRGCDSWIAVEGTIDSNSAARFRRFLQTVKGRKLPVYFSSPGGNTAQAMTMGRMLRERAAVGRIARTLVKECGDAQTEAACLKIKRSGRELAAELTTQRAMCNSACPLFLAGAVSREIPAEISPGVHAPQTRLRTSRPIPADIRARLISMSQDRYRRDAAVYLTQMGIDRALLDMSLKVKYESNHPLTREELVQYRFDSRQAVADGVWRLETTRRPHLRKFAAVRSQDNGPFRFMELQLACEASGARLTFARIVDRPAGDKPGNQDQTQPSTDAKTDEQAKKEPAPASRVTIAEEALVNFRRAGRFEIWSSWISWDRLMKLSQLERLPVRQAVDGKPAETVFEFVSFDLPHAASRLAESCKTPPQPDSAPVANAERT